MAQEYMLGRSMKSALKIPEDKTEVSVNHAKIIITDNGSWILEDLGSTNGTYVKDENGYFQKISRKTIDETTIIRLGVHNQMSYTLMAHRVLAPEAGYSYEFAQLQRSLSKLLVEEEALNSKNARNMNLVLAASPVGLLLSYIPSMLFPSLKDEPSINMNVTRVVMGVFPILVRLCLRTNPRLQKEIKAKRARLLLCPKCGFPISEFDINNMYCSRCKAH